MHQVLKMVLLGVVVLGGAYGLYRYEKRRSYEAQLQEQVRRLEMQRQQLQRLVARLTSERRIAEIVVTEQVNQNSRIQRTTLMFLEYGRNGKALPPKFFTINGNMAHIDALVIKFEREWLEKDDPLRGHSLALFYRIYGEDQAPADGFRIDQPGVPPAIYQDDTELSPEARAFEQQLWSQFWQLADDPKLRQEKGVHVAQGEGVWTYFYPDRLYTLTIGAAGGLSITSRPMDGIWRELRQALTRPK